MSGSIEPGNSPVDFTVRVVRVARSFSEWMESQGENAEDVDHFAPQSMRQNSASPGRNL